MKIASGNVSQKFVTNKTYTMRTIITILFISILNFSFAQVAIGKNFVNGTSTLLDFSEENKGIILPWCTTVPTTNLVGGTIILDATSDNRIKYYDGTTWQDLSLENGAVDLTNQNTLTEAGNGTLISDNTTTGQRGDGVLVLESNDKAMILPIVEEPVVNMKSPTPGTMVYDPFNKVICFYNGTSWSFWGQKQ